MEVKPFGIDVIVVEPGGIVTDWGVIAGEHLKNASAKGAYAQEAGNVAENMIKNYTGNRLTKPDVIARCIGRAVTASRPKTRYLLGSFAPMMVSIKSLLGDRGYDGFIKRLT